MTTALADALRDHRARHGLSQREVAAALGVTQASVSKIENGGNVRPRHVPALAALLGLDPADISRMTFSGDENPSDVIARLDELDRRHGELLEMLGELTNLQRSQQETLGLVTAQQKALREQLELLLDGGDDDLEDGDPRADG